MCDIRDSIDLIINAVVRDENLVTAWANMGIRNVLDSFARSPAAHPAPDGTCSPEALSSWLAETFHPRLIEETITDRFRVVPVAELDVSVRNRLREWCTLLASSMRTPEYCAAEEAGLPFLHRLRETVGELMRALGA